MFDGLDDSLANQDDNLLYAARLSFNFLNIEEPGLLHQQHLLREGRGHPDPRLGLPVSGGRGRELALYTNKAVWPSLFARLNGAQRDRIEEVLAIIGLAESRYGRAGVLSHGQKQWLEIGMLHAEPETPVAGRTGGRDDA